MKVRLDGRNGMGESGVCDVEGVRGFCKGWGLRYFEKKV